MAYGFMTKSYLNSTEHRQTKRERKEVTKKYERREIAFPQVEVELQCNCRSFRLPHGISAHRTLQNEQDWRPCEERYVFDQEHNCWVLKIQRYDERIR